MFIQDDYDSLNLTKEKIKQLNPQLVFTVVPQRSIEKFYPAHEFPNTKFISILTGYVTKEMIKNYHYFLKQKNRKFLVSYRANNMPLRYGMMGYLKREIGLSFLDYFGPFDKYNIYLDFDDRLYGKDWYNLLSSSVAFLGTESGSNIIDYDGNLEKNLRETKIINNLNYEQLYKNFIAKLEINNLTNQISPKIFELISTATIPILIEGEYSKRISDHNYIKVNKDFSNWHEVNNNLNNTKKIKLMTEKNYEEILLNKNNNYDSLTDLIYLELSNLPSVTLIQNQSSIFSDKYLSSDLIIENNDLKKNVLDEKDCEVVIFCYYDTKKNIAGIDDIVKGITKGLKKNNHTVIVLNFFEINKKFGSFKIPLQYLDFKFQSYIIHNTISYDPNNLININELNNNLFQMFSGKKIMMRQDDNNHLDLFEKTCLSFGITHLYSCVPVESSTKFYSISFLEKLNFRNMYTCYVVDQHYDLAKKFSKKSFLNRKIDIGYRGSEQPLYLGKGAYDKQSIVKGFLERSASNKNKYVFDFSNKWEDRIYGYKWLSYLSNCKAVLGTESGGTIFHSKDLVDEMFREHKYWCEVEDNDPDLLLSTNHLENGEEYLQISPRHIEAAITGTLQILFEGRYSDILRPNLDYIVLKKDFSNVNEVLKILDDPSKCQKIIQNCMDRILSYNKIKIDYLVAMINKDLKTNSQQIKKHYDVYSHVVNLCNHQPHKDPRISWVSQTSKPSILYTNLGFDLGLGPWDCSSFNFYWQDEKGLDILTEKIDLIPHVSSILQIAPDEINENNWLELVVKCLKSDQFSNDPKIKKFIKYFCDFLLNIRQEKGLSELTKWHFRYFILSFFGATLALKKIPIKPTSYIATDLPCFPAIMCEGMRLKVPVIVDLHEWYPSILFPDGKNNSLADKFLDFQRNLLNYADTVVSVSPVLEKKLLNNFKNKFKTLLIPNCSPLSTSNISSLEIRGKMKINAEKCIFLFQGNYAPQRGIERIIEAFSKLNNSDILVLRIPDINNCVSKLKDFAYKTLQLSNLKVIFRPAVKEENLIASSAYADVGIISYEKLNNFGCCPNKLSQYAAAGLAIITSDVPFPKKIVEENELGYVYDDIDTNALADVMKKISNDKNSRDIFKKNSKNFFLKKFNWETYSKQFTEPLIGNFKPFNNARFSFNTLNDALNPQDVDNKIYSKNLEIDTPKVQLSIKDKFQVFLKDMQLYFKRKFDKL